MRVHLNKKKKKDSRSCKRSLREACCVCVAAVATEIIKANQESKMSSPVGSVTDQILWFHRD